MTRPPLVRPITGTGNSPQPPRQRLDRATAGEQAEVRANPALGSSDTGNAPLPIWLRVLDHCHRRRAVECARDRRQDPLEPLPRSRREARVNSRSAGSRAASRSGSRTAATSLRGRRGGSCRGAARVSAAFSRAPRPVVAADDSPVAGRQRLIPKNITRSAPASKRFGDRRLMRQAAALEIDPACHSRDHRPTAGAPARERQKFGRGSGGREPLDFGN